MHSIICNYVKHASVILLQYSGHPRKFTENQELITLDSSISHLSNQCPTEILINEIIYFLRRYFQAVIIFIADQCEHLTVLQRHRYNMRRLSLRHMEKTAPNVGS